MYIVYNYLHVELCYAELSNSLCMLNESPLQAFISWFQVCHNLNDEKAMQIAKKNVVKNFPVVGVLEMYNITLKVLESKLPQYFKGAILVSNKSFLNAYKKEKAANHGDVKPKVSQKVREIIEKKLHNEIDFYRFCVQRLKQQYSQICGQ